jgi:hypothetical protein
MLGRAGTRREQGETPGESDFDRSLKGFRLASPTDLGDRRLRLKWGWRAERDGRRCTNDSKD